MSHITAARSKLVRGKVNGDLEGGKKRPRYRDSSSSDSDLGESLVNGDLGTTTPLGPKSRAKQPRRLSTSTNLQGEREQVNENMVMNGITPNMIESAMRTPVVLMQRDPIASAMMRSNISSTALKR